MALATAWIAGPLAFGCPRAGVGARLLGLWGAKYGHFGAPAGDAAGGSRRGRSRECRVLTGLGGGSLQPLRGRTAVEEQVAERAIIRATPEQCFDILTDFDRYPEWSPDIKAVRVLESDDRSRPTRVAFRAAAFGRSTSLTLAYDYSDAPKQLAWVQVDGDLTRRYDGAYIFEAGRRGDPGHLPAHRRPEGAAARLRQAAGREPPGRRAP